MSLEFMGAVSSERRETNVLRLKAYLDSHTTENYRSDEALQSVHLYNWRTFISYLVQLKKEYWNNLTANGKQNYEIAWRESHLLMKAQEKAKRHHR